MPPLLRLAVHFETERGSQRLYFFELEQGNFLLEALPEQGIVIDPLVFLEVFDGAKHLDREETRNRIVKRIKAKEGKLSAERKKPVLGVHSLRLASMRARHEAKKFGKKMLCLGSTQEIRLPYINWLKVRLAELLELRKLLRLSEFLQSLPPEFFAPGGILRANLVPSTVLIF